MGFLDYENGALQIETRIKYCSKYHEWPICMEENTGRVYLDQGWKPTLWWTAKFLQSWFLLSFMIFRLVEALQSNIIVIAEVVFMLVLIIFCVLPVYINAAFFFNGHHIVSVFNLALPLFKAYEASNPDASPPESTKPLAWYLKVLRYTILSDTIILYFVIMLLRLDAAESILSAIPEHWGELWMVRCLVVILYAIHARSIAVSIGVFAVLILSIPVWTTHTLRNLRERTEPVDCDSTILDSTFKTYTQLRIICGEFNKSVAILIPSAKLCTIVSAVFGIYAFVKLDGVVAMFCGLYALNTTASLECVLNVFAGIQSESVAYLEVIRGRVHRKQIFGKQFKAAVHVAVGFGGRMYFADKELMLTLLDIIINQAVSFLIAF